MGGPLRPLPRTRVGGSRRPSRLKIFILPNGPGRLPQRPLGLKAGQPGGPPHPLWWIDERPQIRLVPADPRYRREDFGTWTRQQSTPAAVAFRER
jgi:hypothetical protein